MNRAIIFRAYRGLTGKVFPFDKTYFFEKEQESLLPRIFPYSLVLPVTKGFRDMLFQASKTASGNTRSLVRPFERGQEWKLRSSCSLEPVLDNPEKYLALVPTLYLKHHPAYLTARRHTKTGDKLVEKLVSKTVTNEAYFLIRSEKKQPICLACCNVFNSLSGRCSFGQFKCYDFLRQSGLGTFQETMRRYDELLHREPNRPS